MTNKEKLTDLIVKTKKVVKAPFKWAVGQMRKDINFKRQSSNQTWGEYKK